MPIHEGDRAFVGTSIMGSDPELVFAGATSFCRRRYTRDLTGVDVVVSGVPWDCTTTYRPGARLGPRAIRAASANLCFGKVWPWNIDPFDHLGVIDWGDVTFDEGYRETMAARLEAHARTIVSAGRKMLTLGGDHYIALPVLRAYAERYGKVALVHFDAHSDTWDEDYEHHGTMFLTALDEGLIDNERSVQIGIRTFNAEDQGMTILTAPWVHDHGAEAVAQIVRERVGDRPAYLSFDIDCLDPVFAPGTGTPVCGGLSMYQVQSILYRLVGIDFVGMDLVEVSPPYDHAEVTALAGATLALDWLCLLAANQLGSGPPDPYQGGGATPRRGRA
jgi:agmatinase